MIKSKILAIIPARGGSKRIPRKNIKDFLGKPIIAYSIETALKSKIFDEIMVSTDDREIAKIAKKYGAKVPFLRSKKNSDDFSTTDEVIEEVLNEYEKRMIHFDIFCCIYPTAPLIQMITFKKCFDLLLKNKFDSVFPVIQYSSPIQRALKMSGSKVELYYPKNLGKRTQDFQHSYYDSGQFYWMWTNKFIKTKTTFPKNTGAIVISDLIAHDIDNLDDWKMAELKYNYNIDNYNQ